MNEERYRQILADSLPAAEAVIERSGDRLLTTEPDEDADGRVTVGVVPHPPGATDWTIESPRVEAVLTRGRAAGSVTELHLDVDNVRRAATDQEAATALGVDLTTWVAARHEVEAGMSAVAASGRDELHDELDVVHQEQWWAHATPQQVADTYQHARAWAEEDPEAARAVRRIGEEVRTRYGVDLPTWVAEQRQARESEPTFDLLRRLDTGMPHYRRLPKTEALDLIGGLPADARLTGYRRGTGTLDDVVLWRGKDVDVDRALAEKFPDILRAAYDADEESGKLHRFTVVDDQGFAESRCAFYDREEGLFVCEWVDWGSAYRPDCAIGGRTLDELRGRIGGEQIPEAVYAELARDAELAQARLSAGTAAVDQAAAPTATATVRANDESSLARSTRLTITAHPTGGPSPIPRPGPGW